MGQREHHLTAYVLAETPEFRKGWLAGSLAARLKAGNVEDASYVHNTFVKTLVDVAKICGYRTEILKTEITLISRLKFYRIEEEEKETKDKS